MNKIASLRAAVASAAQYLTENPDKLTVFVDRGAIVATGAKSDSFEYRYVANLLILDYSGDVDVLMVAMMKWVRKYQPDLITNADQRTTGLTFEADINNNATADLSIKLQLTESIVVNTAADGATTIEHVDDSDHPWDTPWAHPWNTMWDQA